jgi:hydroxyacylglutathione hydrolase
MEKGYEILKIIESFYGIEEESVRSFLFIGTERALLVDSGLGVDNMKEIVKSITQLPIILINTHVDPDHIACNSQFHEIYMHPAEYALYHNARLKTDVIKPLWEGNLIELT